jgi:ubiquinone/menaquinone biosynthesis C-methylase UbiE
MTKISSHSLTQEQLERFGYNVPAAPPGEWRDYDETNPVPRYFDFDWLSSRHPDLYHAFALSSTGLVEELTGLFDLSGLEVVDICAGTGRITQGLARKAWHVTAVDVFPSVLEYGKALSEQAGLTNICYVRGSSLQLPIPDNSFDAATCAWGLIHYPEAWRVLRPGGWLIDLIPAPGALCGELTPLLADVYPWLITEVAAPETFAPSNPVSDFLLHDDTWNGVPVISPTQVHEFTYVSEYADPAEAAAIVGRLYGPKAKSYMLDGQRSRLSWRMRVVINRVKK